VAALLPALTDAQRVTVARVDRRRPDARAAVLVAQLLAARGRDVLLVDATPRRPSVHRALGLDLEPGLTKLAADGLKQQLRDLPRVHGVRVLTAGRRPGTDGQSQRERLRRLVEAADESRIMVVVAACGRGLDELLPLVTEGSSDPLVVVVDASTATKGALRQLAAAWRGLGVSVAGAVVQVR
jgi:Mrp family chromosome partitioning ATPase